jgi:hypothetical protein
MEMVMLYFNFMDNAALRALYLFTVFKPYFSDVFTATGNFNAYNGIIA